MKNVVHLIDCMNFMKALPDNSYDLAIVDPPYGIIHEEKKTGFLRGRSWMVTAQAMKWDVAPLVEYFSELKRVSANQIVWGGNYFGNFLGKYVAPIVWDKKTGKNYFADGEMAWTSFKNGTLRIFQYQQAGCFSEARRRGEIRIHPTQKPVALYKWLLQNYAKTGQTIFDSHVGSGSIRIACHDLGFDFEGCEIDADYWEAQESRYRAHAAQSTLFQPEEMRSEPVQTELIEVQ